MEAIFPFHENFFLQIVNKLSDFHQNESNDDIINTRHGSSTPFWSYPEYSPLDQFYTWKKKSLLFSRDQLFWRARSRSFNLGKSKPSKSIFLFSFFLKFFLLLNFLYQEMKSCMDRAHVHSLFLSNLLRGFFVFKN